MGIVFGPDPVEEEVIRALEALQHGGLPPERLHVDLKEEAGRRDHRGAVQPGQGASDVAAKTLAAECACMANTPGGGVLIFGVANDGQLIGTSLDPEWLRQRLHELLDRRLTVAIREVHVNDVRLLLIRCPQAVEPIRYKGKILWRVNDRCVEVDASAWMSARRQGLLFDWSAQPSNHPKESAREAAVEAVRDFLRASHDESACDLAEVPTYDLLSRLNAVTGEGFLTNAGALVFVGRPEPAIDYIRREHAGADSTERVRRADRSLIEQLVEVFAAARSNNPVVHLGEGLSKGQVRQIPERALREALVNGLAHREWGLPDPTVVEHIGGALRVTSPGGFFGGVSEENIITHPSKSRNTALTELLASIKVAEREGVGVDRMIADMLRLGLRRPDIHEIPGPHVLVTLAGDHPDVAWIAWLDRFDDPAARHDLRHLMAVDHLVRQGWIDLDVLAPVLQLTPVEANDTIQALLRAQVDGQPLLMAVEGVPASAAPAYALAASARQTLEAVYGTTTGRAPVPARADVARRYALARGRISTTELGSLVNASPTNVGGILKDLENEGLLEPARPSRRGAGFFYRAVTQE